MTSGSLLAALPFGLLHGDADAAWLDNATPAPGAATSSEREPNHYTLAGVGTEVTYSTTSISGAPQLSYRDAEHQQTFTGDDIDVLPSRIGQLVSVVIELVPDLRTLIATVVVPSVNLQGGATPFTSLLIMTTQHENIGGPSAVPGPLQTYRVVSLEGTAQRVTF